MQLYFCSTLSKMLNSTLPLLHWNQVETVDECGWQSLCYLLAVIQCKHIFMHLSIPISFNNFFHISLELLCILPKPPVFVYITALLTLCHYVLAHVSSHIQTMSVTDIGKTLGNEVSQFGDRLCDRK